MKIGQHTIPAAAPAIRDKADQGAPTDPLESMATLAVSPTRSPSTGCTHPPQTTTENRLSCGFLTFAGSAAPGVYFHLSLATLCTLRWWCGTPSQCRRRSTRSTALRPQPTGWCRWRCRPWQHSGWSTPRSFRLPSAVASRLTESPTVCGRAMPTRTPTCWRPLSSRCTGCTAGCRSPTQRLGSLPVTISLLTPPQKKHANKHTQRERERERERERKRENQVPMETTATLSSTLEWYAACVPPPEQPATPSLWGSTPGVVSSTSISTNMSCTHSDAALLPFRKSCRPRYSCSNVAFKTMTTSI